MGLVVESLTREGLGRLADGRQVPRVLPGEEIALDEAGQARIVTPSAQRVTPPCRHARRCGGCLMQHASDDLVADWKATVLRRAFEGQGLRAEIESLPPSPPQSRRRARFSSRRTKGGALVGFHARASDEIVEVPDCVVIRPALRALLPGLQALAEIAASRKSEVALTVTETRGGADVLVETDRPLTPDLIGPLAALAEVHGIARLTWGAEAVVLRAPPAQRMGRAEVVPPPGAFLQATAEGEAALVAAVRRALDGARRIADLFAGCGTFALPFSETAEVHAAEGEAAMMAALDRAWRATPGLHKVTTETRDLFRRPLLPEDLKPFDAVVIDPPRAGAEAQVIALAASSVGRIAMVSCNPVTLARDARILIAAGWQMGPVALVDQFRWSAHIEATTLFTRA